MSLTHRQQQILEFLREHAESLPRPPTLDELCGLLGLRSRGSLHKHIQALAAQGYVEPLKGRHGGVRLTPKAADPDALPYLGKIAAGRQIAAIAQSETMQVPLHLRSQGNCYVLRVNGDSMCEAGILDGDYVVVEHRTRARDGEIVVALIGGEDTTLKRIRQTPGRVLLIPENSGLEPLALDPDEVEIQGVVIGLMRRYT